MKKQKMVLIGIAALILLAIGWSAFNHIYYGRQFEQRVAELKAQGFPVSLDDLEKSYVLPEGTPNAADVYLEAFANYQEPNEAVKGLLPYPSYTSIIKKGVLPFSAGAMSAVKTHIDRNQQTIKLLKEASRIKDCCWPGNRDVDFWSNPASGLLESIQLLCTLNLYLSVENNTEESVESIEAIMALSNIFYQQPSGMDLRRTHLIQFAMVENMQHVLALTSFSESQLKHLQEQVAEWQTDMLYKALLTERCLQIHFWREPAYEQNKVFYLNTAYKFNNHAPKIIVFLYRLSRQKQQDKLLSLHYYEKFLDAAQLPIYQRCGAFEKVYGEIECLSRWHLYLYGLRWNVTSNFYNLKAMGELRCLETSLAIERYRLKYNALPETLEQLVPEFMAQVPRDPFDNEVLRYIKNDVGYTIYTIGEDGIDNGGASQRQAEEQAGTDTDAYDWPFTVRR